MQKKIWLGVLILTLMALSYVLWIPKTTGEDKTQPEPILAEPEVITVEPMKPIETPKPKVISSAPQRPAEPSPYHIPDGLDPKTLKVLNDLIPCESGGKSNALNKVDRDGTASYGLLQFKPSTFWGAVKLIQPEMTYDEAFNAIYDPNLQIRAFLAWYGDGKPKEWWQLQFPDCSRKHGYWLNL